MAFTPTLVAQVKGGLGSKAFHYGTYTNDGGSTGGDIKTQLGQVDGFWLAPKGSSVIATASVINETFPLVNENGTVTVVTSADEVGQWYAFGS